MNSVSKDLLKILKTHHYLIFSTRVGFYGQSQEWVPDVSDYPKSLSISENTFSMKDRCQDKTIPALRSNFIQIRLFDLQYDAGYNDAFKIERFLDQLPAFSVDYGLEVCYYQTILSDGDPFLLEKDAKDRYIFICNFEVKRTVKPK